MVVKFEVEAFFKKYRIKLSKYIKKLIIYKFKIKNNTSYPILLMETNPLYIESDDLR